LAAEAIDGTAIALRAPMAAASTRLFFIVFIGFHNPCFCFVCMEVSSTNRVEIGEGQNRPGPHTKSPGRLLFVPAARFSGGSRRA
jgi:hypothetical protein